jgi:hypothetical protein
MRNEAPSGIEVTLIFCVSLGLRDGGELIMPSLTFTFMALLSTFSIKLLVRFVMGVLVVLLGTLWSMIRLLPVERKFPA